MIVYCGNSEGLTQLTSSRVDFSPLVTKNSSSSEISNDVRKSVLRDCLTVKEENSIEGSTFDKVSKIPNVRFRNWKLNGSNPYPTSQVFFFFGSVFSSFAAAFEPKEEKMNKSERLFRIFCAKRNGLCCMVGWWTKVHPTSLLLVIVLSP